MPPSSIPAPSRLRPRLVVAGAAVLALVGFVGTLVPTWFAPGEDAAVVGAAVRLCFGPACHQIPERSLTLGGRPLAVCARCSGLYLGGVSGLVLAALWFAGPVPRRFPPVGLLIAAAPTFVDALLPWVGLPGLANLPRALVAWPAGAAAGILLGIAIADLTRGRQRSKTTPPTLALEEVDG